MNNRAKTGFKTLRNGTGQINSMALLIALAILALVLAGCGTDTATEPGVGEPATGVEEPADEGMIGEEEGMVGEEEGMVGEEEGAMGAGGTGFVELSQLEDNPEQYYGQTITTRGDFVDMVGQSAFQLDDPALMGFDTLLVIGADEMVIPQDPAFFTPGDEPDANIQVTGTLREFVMTDIENEYGFDLDDALFGEYEGRPVLVADNVETITGE